jgi:ligand-binding sensor domain-containing protein/serine phosphatase RsbU (regulator of sigma subunit)
MIRSLGVYILTIVLILFGNHIFAQLPNYKYYNVENGFPQSNADHIYQDNDGFMWFATQNGAVKFDGHNFVSLDKSSGLAGNVINHINQDHLGNYWVSTTAGLSYISDEHITNYTTKDGLASNFVYYSTETSDKRIFIVTNKSAAIIEDGKIFQADTSIYTILFIELYNKDVLALSRNKLYKMNGKSYTPCGIDISEIEKPYTFITQAKDSSIWIAGNNGIFRINNNTIEQFTEEDGLISNKINYLFCDSENNMWYSSERLGFGKYSKGHFQNFTAEAGLSNNSVLCIYEDTEKNIWIGGRNGITMINPKVPFLHYNMISPYNNEIVLGMNEDSQGNLWFCTYGYGLFKYNGKTFINYNKSNGSIDNHFFDTEFDKHGNMWLASTNSGVIKFDGEKFMQVPTDQDKIISKRIFTILKDSKNNLWFGTNQQGVYVYNGRKLKKFSQFPELNNARVMAIEEDFNGNIVFGTFGQGIFLFNGDSLQRLVQNYSSELSIIRAIEKTDNQLWFATASDGIFTLDYRQKNSKASFIQKKDGLNSNNIYLLYYDSKGNLWCGSEKGTDKIQFNSDNSIKNIKNYTVNEGFIGVETNINAVMEDSKGNLWFGTINGAVKYIDSIDTKNIAENKTYITQVKLFFEDNEIEIDYDSVQTNHQYNAFTLPYNKNHLIFNFIGLCFSNPQKVMYKYRLKGQNDQWSPPTEVNSAVYTNLAPGSYEFQVLSANNDGIWNTSPVSIQFEIEPPFWQELWFKTSLILIILILIYMFAEFRIRSLKKAKIKLENMVQLRTSELNDQKDRLLQSNLKIKDGINYAEKIQSAMLPSIELFEKSFADYFILYQPKDIISGDFYWAKEISHSGESHIIVAAADCTGHGIPGALVSMLGMSLLNEVIRKKDVQNPAQVLEELRIEIKRSLHQKGGIEDQTEGIDMVLIKLNPKTRILDYSGANNPLYILRDKKLKILEPTINPVGIFIKELPFVNHQYQLEKNDVLYLFSDGFVDQFNGKTGEKYKIGRFRELLISISENDLSSQKEVLKETFMKWKAGSEQIDDVLVMGFKIK